MKRLAIITTHPIQYNAPLFALLAKRAVVDVCVFYTWGETVLHNKFDPGFGKKIEWDIPLLQGYNYTFVENVAIDKGSHHFKGIVNPGLVGMLSDYKPDAILVYGWSFHSHLKVIRYFKNKIPLLFRGDSTLIDPIGFIGNLKRKIFLRWVYSHINVALYCGKSNYRYFTFSGLKDKQLVFAPHAIDNARFACVENDCKEKAYQLRAQLGLQHDNILFMFAGKLEPKKAPDVLIRAFMKDNIPGNAHLLIVGSGELEASLKKMAASNSRIHFLDFQNQQMMPSVYNACDVFVLPSIGPGETWGLAVNEAMAGGKPVIVSDKCGCAEDLVKNALNGFIVEAGNIGALNGCMKDLAFDKNRLSRMGAESMKIISAYSVDQVANAIENILDPLDKIN